MIDIIVGGGIAVFCILVVVSRIKKMKKGDVGCGCGCAGCSASCGQKPEESGQK